MKKIGFSILLKEDGQHLRQFKTGYLAFSKHGYNFAVDKRDNEDWVVTETSSGALIANHNTRKGAIATALERVEGEGKERIDYCVNGYLELQRSNTDVSVRPIQSSNIKAGVEVCPHGVKVKQWTSKGVGYLGCVKCHGEAGVRKYGLLD